MLKLTFILLMHLFKHFIPQICLPFLTCSTHFKLHTACLSLQLHSCQFCLCILTISVVPFFSHLYSLATSLLLSLPMFITRFPSLLFLPFFFLSLLAAENYLMHYPLPLSALPHIQSALHQLSIHDYVIILSDLVFSNLTT